MDQAPIIARPKGYYFEIKAGDRYLWCSCGRSANQPFCDGSHVGTGFLPVPFKAKQDDEVLFCGCKHTKTPPFCDGSHNNLPGGYGYDDPDSAANHAVRMVVSDAAMRRLDGTCYVFRPSLAELKRRANLAYCAAVSPGQGALFQSQFYAEAGPGASPVIDSDGRHVVLFVTEGAGEVEISGRRFPLTTLSGVYVRPGEAFRLHNPDAAPIRVFISQGPGAEDLVFLDAMPDNFQAAHPNRIAELDAEQRNDMGDRFYQVLINREHGSDVVTQFIGNIPLSKGEPHRHLYEEALIILNGTGVVWTADTRTEVQGGDVLFLPRKQIHSVQCTTARGFDVVGVIYPGDNPSINY